MRNVLFGAGVATALIGMVVFSTYIGWGLIITLTGVCIAGVTDPGRYEPTEPKRSTWLEDGMIQ